MTALAALIAARTEDDQRREAAGRSREKLREFALAALVAGESPSVVAREAGVSRQQLHTWRASALTS